MEEASDNEHEPAPVASFTMAQAYFKAIMVEKEQSEHPTPRASAFQMVCKRIDGTTYNSQAAPTHGGTDHRRAGE